MPSPFPGMDPWLEDPLWFPNLHILLLTATNRILKQQLRPRGYLVAMNERVWVSEPGRSIGPDVAIVKRPQRAPSPGATTVVLEADEPVLEGCPCPACAHGYSRAYVHYLLKAQEQTAQRLLTIHNLAYLQYLMAALRDAIDAGRLAEAAAATRSGAAPWQL